MSASSSVPRRLCNARDGDDALKGLHTALCARLATYKCIVGDTKMNDFATAHTKQTYPIIRCHLNSTKKYVYLLGFCMPSQNASF